MPNEPENEFTAAVRRAGLAIPPERWAAMREAYFGMQALLKILDDPLTYADEPAVLPHLAPRRRP